MASIITRAGKGAPLTNNELDSNFTNLNTALNPLRQAVRVAMTAAASGGNGIQAPDNDNLDMGTNNFTLHWEGSLPDWTPAAIQTLLFKYQSSVGVELSVRSPSGLAQLIINTSTIVSTVPISLTDASLGKITVVVVRESASVDGSITFYVNGVQLGSPVVRAAASPATVSTGSALFIGGTNVARTASDTTNAIIYNRALSAAEVLSLSVNGAALADIGASQLSAVSGSVLNGTSTRAFSTFSSGADNFTGTTLAGDASLNYAGYSIAVLTGQKIRVKGTFSITGTLGSAAFRINIATSLSDSAALSDTITVSGTSGDFDVVLTATSTATGIVNFSLGTSPVTDATITVTSIAINRLGITGQWNAENAQSNTGQIFDSSGNKNHALLPAAGATIIGKPVSGIRQVRWTNTWAGTNELQYIGGVNQAILPANAYIDSIIGTVSGATPHDIIIGDGSDTDRYVTITTGLAAGTTTFTLANRTTDGTNLKLTVDPDTNCVMSIAWVISYRILES